MQSTFVSHATEETLERYSLGTLGDAELASFEEHLLVCALCQDRLAETETFIRATRQAAQNLPSEPAPGVLLGWLRWRRPVWAALAAAVIVLAGAAGLWTAWRQPGAPPVAVALEALRGGEGLPGVQAPSGRPLLLRVDLAGLPESGSYDLDVVNAEGRTLQRTTLRRTGGAPEASVARLERGQYWVRLYSPPPQRELLREFGLRVE